MTTLVDIGTLIVRSPEIRNGQPRIAGTGVDGAPDCGLV